MENNDFNKLFEDFRRANRIVALVQGRIRDIVFYIKSQTRFQDSEIAGIKLFSQELRNRNNETGKLKVEYNTWPWDFLYGYVFEYRFFYEKDKSKGVMSIIQVCDDGYIGNPSKTDIKSFTPVSESKSWLILTYSEGNEKIPIENVKSWENEIYKGDKLIAKRYEMAEFSDEDKINEIIVDFNELVEDQGNKMSIKTFYKK